MAKNESGAKPETIQIADDKKCYCKTCGHELALLVEKGPRGGRLYWCESCNAKRKKCMPAPPSEEEKREAAATKDEGDVIITEEGEVLVQFTMLFPLEILGMYDAAMAAKMISLNFNDFIVQYATAGFINIHDCELSLVQRQGGDPSGELAQLRNEMEVLKGILRGEGAVFSRTDLQTGDGDSNYSDGPDPLDDPETPDESLN